MQQPVGAHVSCVALLTSGSRPPLLMRHVNARYVVFRSFGEGSEGGLYYDTLDLTHAKHPQTLLAYEMNGHPLPLAHGAPLRLRIETKLGFKMVKWIKTIEFVEDFRHLGEGRGGYDEDKVNFGWYAEI